MARHSDIVLLTTSFLERNDIAMGHWDRTITPMHKVIEPIGESKTDYEIFLYYQRNWIFTIYIQKIRMKRLA